MVRPPPARAYPSSDCRQLAQADRARNARAIHALAVALAARCRPARNCSASAALWKPCGRCRALKLPPMPGSGQILARRVAELRSRKCSTIFRSPAPSVGDAFRRIRPLWKTTTAERRRVIPTSVAPIAFFVREDADWMMPPRANSTPKHRARHSRPEPGRGRRFAFLQQRGASFFADIVRGTGKLKAEVETALWELVTAGLLTADGFDNLRALIDPQPPRRAGKRPQPLARVTAPAAGRCSMPTKPSIAPQRSKPICWMLLAPLWRGVPRSARPAKRFCRRGAKC